MELNNAFYRLPERAMFQRWRQRTPDGFVMAVRASRYLTQVDVGLLDRCLRVRTAWRDPNDVVAFFNNDPGGAAVRDAVSFGEALAAAGRRVSRLPDHQTAQGAGEQGGDLATDRNDDHGDD